MKLVLISINVFITIILQSLKIGLCEIHFLLVVNLSTIKSVSPNYIIIIIDHLRSSFNLTAANILNYHHLSTGLLEIYEQAFMCPNCNCTQCCFVWYPADPLIIITEANNIKIPGDL